MSTCTYKWGFKESVRLREFSMQLAVIVVKNGIKFTSTCTYDVRGVLMVSQTKERLNVL